MHRKLKKRLAWTHERKKKQSPTCFMPKGGGTQEGSTTLTPEHGDGPWKKRQRVKRCIEAKE